MQNSRPCTPNQKDCIELEAECSDKHQKKTGWSRFNETSLYFLGPLLSQKETPGPLFCSFVTFSRILSLKIY